ncbi:MAG: dimethyl sulfoxide reductase anchor subunit [Bacteroidales bacterium]|nr:dimethyl sulfoxide reductase anchor subunit [Bacteroidales bacterium]
MHEWSLIIFTLFTQFAVGAFVVTGLVERQQQTASTQNIIISTNAALLIIVIAAMVALMASFLHLGNPSNALYALNNLASSWLSREILLLSLFTGGAILFLLLNFKSYGSRALRNVTAYMTALTGLLAVFSMAKVYMLETVPVWNTILTPVQFFLTAFILGGMGVFQITKGMNTSLAQRWLKGLFVLIIASIVVWLTTTYLISGSGIAEKASLEILFIENRWLFYGRILLLAISILLLLYPIVRQSVQGKSGLFVAVFLILIIAEVIGRYLFYASYVRVGV